MAVYNGIEPDEFFSIAWERNADYKDNFLSGEAKICNAKTDPRFTMGVDSNNKLYLNSLKQIDFHSNLSASNAIEAKDGIVVFECELSGFIPGDKVDSQDHIAFYKKDVLNKLKAQKSGRVSKTTQWKQDLIDIIQSAIDGTDYGPGGDEPSGEKCCLSFYNSEDTSLFDENDFIGSIDVYAPYTVTSSMIQNFNAQIPSWTLLGRTHSLDSWIVYQGTTLNQCFYLSALPWTINSDMKLIPSYN